MIIFEGAQVGDKGDYLTGSGPSGQGDTTLILSGSIGTSRVAIYATAEGLRRAQLGTLDAPGVKYIKIGAGVTLSFEVVGGINCSIDLVAI